jgi:hypothetical protein
MEPTNPGQYCGYNPLIFHRKQVTDSDKTDLPCAASANRQNLSFACRRPITAAIQPLLKYHRDSIAAPVPSYIQHGSAG